MCLHLSFHRWNSFCLGRPTNFSRLVWHLANPWGSSNHIIIHAQNCLDWSLCQENSHLCQQKMSLIWENPQSTWSKVSSTNIGKLSSGFLGNFFGKKRQDFNEILEFIKCFWCVLKKKKLSWEMYHVFW